MIGGFALALARLGFASEPGTVISWGAGWAPLDVPPAGLANVTQVICGGSHFLALRADGAVIGWGYNNYGQASAPTVLPGVVQLAAGERHSLAVHENGTVTCWGDSTYGQCAKPSGLTGVVQASAGVYHNVVLKSDGGVQAWGANWDGQTTIPAIGGARQVACGAYHSLALKVDTTVVGWGYGGNGQTIPPAGLTGVRQITAGVEHSIGLIDDGTVRVWGSGGQNQTQIPASLSNVVQIGATQYGCIALRSDGVVVGWGSGSGGNPIEIPPSAKGIMKIAAGPSGNCVAGVYGVLGSVSTVRPISGPAAGGTPIQINGSNFQPGDPVTIGGVAATHVVFVSSSKITAITPAGFPGEAVVAVGNASATAFYYRPYCGSDLDQDGEVTASDISIVLLDFGPCYSQSGALAPPAPTPLLADEPAQKTGTAMNE
jgi:hypothetical protein